MFRLILSMVITLTVLGPLTGRPAGPQEQVVELPGQTLAPGPGRLVLNMVLPPGYKFTPEAPCQVKLSSSRAEVVSLPPAVAAPASQNPFPLEIFLTAQPGETQILMELQLFFCQTEGRGLCLLKTLHLRLPVRVTPEAAGHRLEVTYHAPVP